MSGRADLVRELKALRKGRGLYANRIQERVGPAVRTACRVGEDDAPLVIRRKVAARFAELAEHLPGDLHLAVLAAFAVHPEARQALYQDRVTWAATRMDRDQRTVRRRVDEALDQLAELAAGALPVPAGTPTGRWYTTELKVVVGLDHPLPEVLELRRIVSNQEGLSELDLAVTLPGRQGELEVELLHGGTLLNRGMEASDRHGFALALPKPLARGESHEFALRFRLATAAVMRPHLVCVPKRRCELFDLWIRFGRDRVPQRVWMLHGVFQRDVSDPLPHGAAHPVNEAGEVHLRFRQLAPGLAYGARWDPNRVGALPGEPH